MSAAPRRRRRDRDDGLDAELADLPPAARWREWMLRVEAAIFASARPVPREALVRVVGQTCRFDDLIADLVQELRGRPYDLALVGGGYALRTKARFTPAIRAANPGRLTDDGLADLTRTETFALTAIAYLQPVTRGEISRLAGREISRDIIASLKRRGLIDGAIRAPTRRPVRLCDDAEIPGGVRLRLAPRSARPRAAQGGTPAAERAGGERPRQRAGAD